MAAKISEILREAANSFLWDGRGIWRALEVHKYCCNAICKAMKQADCEQQDVNPAALFLESLGMPLGGTGFSNWAFNSNLEAVVESYPAPAPQRLDQFEQQQLRYAWLMFAADVAEEEGL